MIRQHHFRVDITAMTARLQLAKVPLCLLIGSAAFFGTLQATVVPSLQTLTVAVGVLLVATGAASLNSLQEYRLDATMVRTKNRPLPTGRLSPGQAGLQAGLLLFCGLLIIFCGTEEIAPLAVTIGAVVLYNGIYTPLKQKTVLAIIPGALCGALPPYIGWLAGGGGNTCTAILIVTLFILWQVPHFWLVLLSHRDDYVGSDFPHLLSHFTEKTLKRLLIVWISALAFVMLMFTVQPYPQYPWYSAPMPGLVIRCGIFVQCLFLPAIFFYCLMMRPAPNYRRLFILLNATLVLHMLLLCAGRIIGE